VHFYRLAFTQLAEQIGIGFGMLNRIFRRQYLLTDEQSKSCALEKDDNFRWISALFAAYSNYTLTDVDLVSEHLCNEISQLG
jgi:hypothetical protein